MPAASGGSCFPAAAPWGPWLLLALALSVAGPPAAAAAPDGSGWAHHAAADLEFRYRDEDTGIARALAGESTEVVARVTERTGGTLPPGVVVTLLPTWTQFADAQPSRPPSWAVGTAYPERGEIYLRTRMPRWGADPIDKVFVHELVHVALHHRLGRDAPRWLDEGAAQLVAGELSAAQHTALLRGALTGNLIPLSQLVRGWPDDPARATLAYAQSAHFVAWLADRRPGAVSALLQGLAADEDVLAALASIAGQPLPELEASWRSTLRMGHALIPLLFGSGATWAFASLLFVFGGLRRRRAMRRQMARLAEEDARLQAAERLLDPWPPPRAELEARHAGPEPPW